MLGEDGRSLTKTTLLEKGGLCEEAAELIERTLAERKLTEGSRPPAVTILLATQAALARAGGPQNAPAWTPQELAALARSDQAYVIRVQPGDRAKVWIVGGGPLGVYYGATTLVQLMTSAGRGKVVLPDVEVQDYPDIPGRMCANWVLTWDWEVNGYDWGDGLDAFIKRCKRKIDFCSRYKVNRVRFLGGRISPGPPYMNDRYEKIKRFALGVEPLRPAQGRGVAVLVCQFGRRLLWLGSSIFSTMDSQPGELSGRRRVLLRGRDLRDLPVERGPDADDRPTPAAIGARRGAGFDLLAQPRPGHAMPIGRGLEAPLPAMPRSDSRTTSRIPRAVMPARWRACTIASLPS